MKNINKVMLTNIFGNNRLKLLITFPITRNLSLVSLEKVIILGISIARMIKNIILMTNIASRLLKKLVKSKNPRKFFIKLLKKGLAEAKRGMMITRITKDKVNDLIISPNLSLWLSIFLNGSEKSKTKLVVVLRELKNKFRGERTKLKNPNLWSFLLDNAIKDPKNITASVFKNVKKPFAR